MPYSNDNPEHIKECVWEYQTEKTWDSGDLNNEAPTLKAEDSDAQVSVKAWYIAKALAKAAA
ncbi:uncharacterized protein N7500_003989 [Penicillium coprophilum]|uniref:uncharacterized protein n=1 Tax=Penicillium coprophilum TaxID=36646 RepID=UPI00239614DB|nr:uncharacterized protein N7500_003989 [Penicillium coprophilum]KAJ5171206.1 hypothetical protein N7500_003989 [Penicillium coprophilum]